MTSAGHLFIVAVMRYSALSKTQLAPLRERLICAALTGLLADPEDQDMRVGASTCEQSVAIMAICYADAVIERLKEEDSPTP